MTTYPKEFKDQLVALHRSGRTYIERSSAQRRDLKR